MWNLIRTEPVRFMAAIQATLMVAFTVAAAYGSPVPDAVVQGAVLALSAWLSFVTRQQVTPNTRVDTTGV